MSGQALGHGPWKRKPVSKASLQLKDAGAAEYAILNAMRMMVVVHSKYPELQLCAAVLEQATNDLMIHTFKSKLEGGGSRYIAYKDSSAWFHSESTAWPFSFERICLALNLDSDRLRNLLKNHGFL